MIIYSVTEQVYGLGGRFLRKHQIHNHVVRTWIVMEQMKIVSIVSGSGTILLF
jgi:hypothetical protein